MVAVTLTAEKASSALQDETWRQETVGAFFARCNWDNLPLLSRDEGPQSAVATLDYSLSVGQFFGSIPWQEGRMPSAMVAPAPDDNPAQVPSGLPEIALDQPDAASNSSWEELPDLSDIADDSHLDGGEVTLGDFLGDFSNSL